MVTLATVLTLSGLPAFVMACASLCGPAPGHQAHRLNVEVAAVPSAVPAHAHHAAHSTHEAASSAPGVPVPLLRPGSGAHDCCPSVLYAATEVAVKVRVQSARPADESAVGIALTLAGSLPTRSIDAHALLAPAVPSASQPPLVLRI